MRITQNMMSARLLTDLQASQTKQASLQSQISSGHKIAKPSDDAQGTHDALRYRDQLDAIDQFKDGVGAATDWLSSTDQALGQVTSIISRVKELTLQAANGATTPAGRQSILSEVTQLIASVKDSANTKSGNEYIFAGTSTTTPPYTQGATDTYAGNTGVVARQIGQGVSVQVNTDGGSIFGSAGGDGKLLDTLRNIQTHLTNGTPADINALSTTDLAALDTNLDQVSAFRSSAGAVQNRVDAASDRLDDLKITTQNMLGNVQDTDLASALMDLTNQQTAYQASLRTGATLIQQSLMDFLS